MEYVSISANKYSLRENIFTSTTIGGESLIIYRIGNLFNIYDSNKDICKSLLPYPQSEIQINSIALALIPLDQNSPIPYSVEELGKTWFIAYRSLLDV